MSTFLPSKQWIFGDLILSYLSLKSNNTQHIEHLMIFHSIINPPPINTQRSNISGLPSWAPSLWCCHRLPPWAKHRQARLPTWRDKTMRNEEQRVEVCKEVIYLWKFYIISITITFNQRHLPLLLTPNPSHCWKTCSSKPEQTSTNRVVCPTGWRPSRSAPSQHFMDSRIQCRVWNIYLYIWLKFMVNVGEYTTHGCYRMYEHQMFSTTCFNLMNHPKNAATNCATNLDNQKLQPRMENDGQPGILIHKKNRFHAKLGIQSLAGKSEAHNITVSQTMSKSTCKQFQHMLLGANCVEAPFLSFFTSPSFHSHHPFKTLLHRALHRIW